VNRESDVEAFGDRHHCCEEVGQVLTELVCRHGPVHVERLLKVRELVACNVSNSTRQSVPALGGVRQYASAYQRMARAQRKQSKLLTCIGKEKYYYIYTLLLSIE
jgi:hypothetical protein